MATRENTNNVWVISEKDMDGELITSVYASEKACRKAFSKIRRELIEVYEIDEDELDNSHKANESKEILTTEDMTINLGLYSVLDEEDCFSIYDNEGESEFLVEIGELPLQTEEDVSD